MSKKERASKAHQEEAAEEQPAAKHFEPAQKPVRAKKISIDLVIPLYVNGKQYFGTIVTEDHDLADLLIEMHEKARAARLQEQVGKVNEVLKIGGRLVIKEVK